VSVNHIFFFIFTNHLYMSDFCFKKAPRNKRIACHMCNTLYSIEYLAARHGYVVCLNCLWRSAKGKLLLFTIFYSFL
jgi:hypothetical protein